MGNFSHLADKVLSKQAITTTKVSCFLPLGEETGNFWQKDGNLYGNLSAACLQKTPIFIGLEMETTQETHGKPAAKKEETFVLKNDSKSFLKEEEIEKRGHVTEGVNQEVSRMLHAVVPSLLPTIRAVENAFCPVEILEPEMVAPKEVPPQPVQPRVMKTVLPSGHTNRSVSPTGIDSAPEYCFLRQLTCATNWVT